MYIFIFMYKYITRSLDLCYLCYILSSSSYYIWQMIQKGTVTSWFLGLNMVTVSPKVLIYHVFLCYFTDNLNYYCRYFKVVYLMTNDRVETGFIHTRQTIFLQVIAMKMKHHRFI